MLAGIDLGGTQVRVALARSDGRLIESIKTKTALLPTAQAMVDWAAAEIDRHRGREKVRSITIAAPGPIDLKRGVLVNPPNLPWPNAPLAAMMSRATGAKVRLANDADMAGLGAVHHGPGGRRARRALYGDGADQPDQRSRPRDVRDGRRRHALLGAGPADDDGYAAIVAFHQAGPPAPTPPLPAR